MLRPIDKNEKDTHTSKRRFHLRGNLPDLKEKEKKENTPFSGGGEGRENGVSLWTAKREARAPQRGKVTLSYTTMWYKVNVIFLFFYDC
ncbi:MAG: hypothetical protein CSA34_04535 [Desulfobulbus propionicus]|nr:MAG: hypothetical protein CSA34_04535 [Desulfobulbus propionicus]